MTSFKSLAIGLTTVAALSTVTAAVASQPIGSERENLDPEKAAQIQEVRDAMQAGDTELAEQLKEQYGLEDFRKGHPGKRMKHAFKNLDEETQEAVKTALGNGDYTAFIAAVGEDKADKLTEERFARMVERHEKREAVKGALEAGDYTAFVEALGDHAPEDLTEEKFGQMVEVHQLRAAGDTEAAKELAKEYGLKKPGYGKRIHRGEDGERGEKGERRGPRGGDHADAGSEE